MHLLTVEERDQIRSRMDFEQINFLDTRLTQSKRTLFANIMAKEIGLDHWVLVDYIDAGESWRQTKRLRCECNKVLRYQYIIQNKRTGDIKRFGINHFEQHTSIPKEIINKVVKGFQEIDFELDEILTKFRLGKIFKEVIPQHITLPDALLTQISLGLPLLDRQEQSLSKFIRDEKRKLAMQEQIKKEREERNVRRAFQERVKAESDTVRHIEYVSENVPGLSEEQKAFIYSLVLNKIESVSEIAETMLESQLAEPKRLGSGKLKIYPLICMYLEILASKELIYCYKASMRDRKYKLK